MIANKPRIYVNDITKEQQPTHISLAQNINLGEKLVPST